MPNSIALASKYVPLLDEVYKAASLTAALDGPAELAKQGANANELIIPKLSMSGLANYNRNSGYVDGDVTLTNETVICGFDRGRMFTVDTLDNEETAGISFGRLSSEFIRTQVVPELDAYRFSEYAQLTGISTTDAATLSTGAAALAALNTFDEDELSVLTEYSGSPPSHFFGSTDFTHNVQLRSRGENSYETISSLAAALNGFRDGEISVTQVSAVLDIGRDAKGRQEYTCNFRIIRY